MTWIKICGITNLEDALVAVDAGADALGFVFYAKSPRNIAPETAKEITSNLPQRIERVGVFVDQSAAQACGIAERTGLTCVQLHKDQTSMSWSEFTDIGRQKAPIKVMVALPGNKLVDGGYFIDRAFGKKLFAILLDSGAGNSPGGTGVSFDWENTKGLVRGLDSLVHVVVAGGLSPTNVGEMMSILRPWGVDVASGVEARPGKKDPEKVRAFISAVRAADGNS